MGLNKSDLKIFVSADNSNFDFRVNYSPSQYDKIETLNFMIDHLRVGAMGLLEELYQTLELNKELAIRDNWKINYQLKVLNIILNLLNKEI